MIVFVKKEDTMDSWKKNFSISMKVLSSLKSAKKRDKNCKIVKRKGVVYVINKVNPKFKAKQG